MHQGVYSIVARDPDTGELGAAAQSRGLAVGSRCIWARPGIGAVATQATVEAAHGPRSLDRLAMGVDADTALAAVLADDSSSATRQVGVIAAQGLPAAYTGRDCIAHAGEVVGESWSCQASMMDSDAVPGAMSAAFAAAKGSLQQRMLAALDAAEGECGGVSGRQSASMLVVPAQGEPWRTCVDLRVDNSADPLGELRRLLGLHRAYELAGEADGLLAAGMLDAAGDRYRCAHKLAPDSDELLFWGGLALAQAGEFDRGVDAVRRAIAVRPHWIVVLCQLSPRTAPAALDVLHALA